MTGLNASFLYLETANAPMHISGLAIYDPSTAPGGKGYPNAPHPSRLYNRMNLQVNPHDVEAVLSILPTVPTTAIYTKGDGVVNWRTSVHEGDSPKAHNIKVLNSHIGLNMNAAVRYWIAKKLARI